MEGVRSLDAIYEFYRRPEFARLGGPEMVRLLDTVADVLVAKLVYFSTSHTRLWLSKAAHGPQAGEQPSVGVWADGRYYNFSFTESWADGPYLRTREDHIRCTIEHARGALLEMLARLKPADSPAG